MKPAFPWTALGLGVAILLLSGGLEGCRSARSALQLPTQGPSLSSQAVRSRAIQGQVLSLQDSVSPVPRVELVFRQVDPDSLARAWRVLTQQDGRYRLVLPAGRRYRVDVSCETRYVATAEIELLQPTPAADSSAVEHPFYVPCQAPEPIREAAPRLYFAAGQASLSPKAVHTLEYVRDVLVLQANTPLAVRLEGHATKQEVPPDKRPRSSTYCASASAERRPPPITCTDWASPPTGWQCTVSAANTCQCPTASRRRCGLIPA
jgi:hypothetical protein